MPASGAVLQHPAGVAHCAATATATASATATAHAAEASSLPWHSKSSTMVVPAVLSPPLLASERYADDKFDRDAELAQPLGRLRLRDMQGVVRPTRLRQHPPQPLPTSQRPNDDDAAQPIGIIGGGVSGIFAALTLRELGYTNITILERERTVGGKAASFRYGRNHYPLGAVSTPLALKESSFTGAQIWEKPLRFATNVLFHSASKLQILDANNLIQGVTPLSQPRRFAAAELSHGAVDAWQHAFSPKGPPERFYPNQIDFRSGRGSKLAQEPEASLLPSWGRVDTSWPLIYVSAHGYGVARAAQTPPFYYWARFAQKSTNAAKIPALGPRGPALRGFDTTGHLHKLINEAHVRLLTSVNVHRISRDEAQVRVSSSGGEFQFSKLVVATDLKAALGYLDADEQERQLFSSVQHLDYYTVGSLITLPWLKAGSVYYLGPHQGLAQAADAGQATGGCPTILFRAARDSNLTISWAYGGAGVGRPEIESCLRRTVERLGGTFGGVVRLQRWADYFPHVSAERLRANYHQQLNRLQGRRRTYLVGEIFNLPLVSECIDWSRHLIRKHFRNQNTQMPMKTSAPPPRVATPPPRVGTFVPRPGAAAGSRQDRAKVPA